jgi:hypothetical protein
VSPTIRIHPVRGDSGNAFLLDVPQGEYPPYQASDGRYYRRINSTKNSMRHYEIAEFLGRRRKPALAVSLEFTRITERQETWEFSMRVYVRNTGLAAARHGRLIVTMKGVTISHTTPMNMQRLDDLRGVPSVQWDQYQGVIHADSESRVRLFDVSGECPIASDVVLGWELLAEDMPRFEDTHVLTPDIWSRYADGFTIDQDSENSQGTESRVESQ